MNVFYNAILQVFHLKNYNLHVCTGSFSISNVFLALRVFRPHKKTGNIMQ